MSQFEHCVQIRLVLETRCSLIASQLTKQARTACLRVNNGPNRLMLGRFEPGMLQEQFLHKRHPHTHKIKTPSYEVYIITIETHG